MDEEPSARTNPGCFSLDDNVAVAPSSGRVRACESEALDLTGLLLLSKLI